MATKPKQPKEKIVHQPKPRTIYDAIADFQKENIVIPRRGTGKSPKGEVYKYATLDDVITITRPLLQKHGLVFAQLVVGSELKTSLVYPDAGAEPRQIDSTISLGKPQSAQDMGARITYMRRYALVPMLGLSIEDDLDAVPPELPPEDTKVPPPAVVNTPKMPQETPSVVSELKETTEAVKNAPQRSTWYQKAYDAIQSCHNEQALEMIKDRVSQSTNLTDTEKGELLEVVKLKETELSGTIHTN